MGGRCCSKVVVAASGPAATVQWDRLGVYVVTGGEHNGRPGSSSSHYQCECAHTSHLTMSTSTFSS